MDNLEFLDGEPSGDESRAEPVRDETGRFAPKAAAETAPPQEITQAAEQPLEPTTAPAPPPESAVTPPGHVPLTALLDTRDKLKAAEARLAQIENQRQAPQVPDRYADPDAYDDWLQSQLIGQTRKLTLQFSERMAKQAYGDLFDKAKEWGIAKCDADPFFNQRLHASDDPFDVVVKEYQQAQALSALQDPGRLDAFLAWQAGQSAAPAPQSSAAQPHPSPPRSLASAPAAGGAKPGAQPVGEGVAFDSIFKG
jgi:hypothetical protein